jgi:hypothetical protein
MEGPAFQLPYRSLREMTGHTDRRRKERQSTQQQDFRRVLRDVARDDFSPAQPVLHALAPRA